MSKATTTTVAPGVYRTREYRHTILLRVEAKRRRAGGKLVPYEVVHHVPMQEGQLVVVKSERRVFDEDYAPIQYPLDRAVDHFVFNHSGGCADAAARELLGVL